MSGGLWRATAKAAHTRALGTPQAFPLMGDGTHVQGLLFDKYESDPAMLGARLCRRLEPGDSPMKHDDQVGDLIADCGRALYGETWQSELARALNINRATVQRWLAGKFQPPAGVWADLMKLTNRRSKQLAALQNRLLETAVARGCASEKIVRSIIFPL